MHELPHGAFADPVKDLPGLPHVVEQLRRAVRSGLADDLGEAFDLGTEPGEGFVDALVLGGDCAALVLV